MARAIQALVVMVAAVTLVSCVSVKAEGFNNPTLPGQQWHLYGGLEIGYAMTLPRTWTAFDLNTQLDLGSRACGLGSQLVEQRRQVMSDLHNRGVRLFACDTSRNTELHMSAAYAVTGAAPPEGLDKYLDGLAQITGREVVDRRHVKTNAGDMVMQKIRERRPMADGSIVATTQYQFLVIRFGALHLLFVDVPTALEESVGKDAELIGTSFTPVR